MTNTAMTDTTTTTTALASSVSQDDINSAVWAACDTFRGTVDPSIYKDFVLTMLFLQHSLFEPYLLLLHIQLQIQVNHQL